jgi:hypothetical protein
MVGGDPRSWNRKPLARNDFRLNRHFALARQQRNYKQHQSDEEYDLRDAHRRSCNPAKTQNAGDEGDDQKRYDEA